MGIGVYKTPIDPSCNIAWVIDAAKQWKVRSIVLSLVGGESERQYKIFLGLSFCKHHIYHLSYPVS